MKLDKVIFLDRDGVINRDSPDYIKSWDEVDFLPGSLDALNLLTRHGFNLILITNQSAVHRGIVSLRVLEHMHQQIAPGRGGRRRLPARHFHLPPPAG